MAYRDDTIRTDAIARVRQALLDAANPRPVPVPTEIARRIAPPAPEQHPG